MNATSSPADLADSEIPGNRQVGDGIGDDLDHESAICRERRRSVGRGTVDDDDFEVGVGLVPQRVESALQRLRTVVRADDNGDPHHEVTGSASSVTCWRTFSSSRRSIRAVPFVDTIAVQYRGLMLLDRPDRGAELAKLRLDSVEPLDHFEELAVQGGEIGAEVRCDGSLGDMAGLRHSGEPGAAPKELCQPAHPGQTTCRIMSDPSTAIDPPASAGGAAPPDAAPIVAIAVVAVTGIVLRWIVLAGADGRLGADESYAGLQAYKILDGDLPIVIRGAVYTAVLESYVFAPLTPLVGGNIVALKVLFIVIWAVASVLVGVWPGDCSAAPRRSSPVRWCGSRPGALLTVSTLAYPGYALGMAASRRRGAARRRPGRRRATPARRGRTGLGGGPGLLDPSDVRGRHRAARRRRVRHPPPAGSRTCGCPRSVVRSSGAGR